VAQTTAGSQGGAISDAEKVLRQRVAEFYTLMQGRQTAKAETYITTEGRERFRSQESGAFLAFRLVSVDMQPDGKNADVVVEMTVLASMVGGMVPFQRNLHWQVEDGEWRLAMPQTSVGGNDSLMGMGKGLEPQAAPEELKFQAHTFGLGIMKHGGHKEIRFPFTNSSDHTVKISQIATGCDCLAVKTKQMEYKKGESGEIVL